MDYIVNGQAHGSTASLLLNSGLDPGVMRPFIGSDGRSYITVPKQDRRGMPILNEKGQIERQSVLQTNATGILLREEWQAIDAAVQRAAMPTLRAWADLRSANTYRIPQGMGATTLVSYMSGDITPAEIAMDPISRADKDFPEMDMTGIPLPVIFKDADFTLRQLEVSRRGAMPLDTTSIELATQKVAEEVEKMTIGNGLGFTYDGYSLYGYTNYPNALTQALTDPTDNGWTPATLVGEIREAKKLSRDAGYNGPWKMYVGSDWELYLDDDYTENYNGGTLRSRIQQIDGISSISTLDYLQGTDIILVQMTPNVARAVVAMEFVTLQWAEEGGMRLRMKVMCIMVPQLRSDFYGGTGIVQCAVPPGT